MVPSGNLGVRGEMRAAFFDIDGTIIRENSMERIFLKYLMEKGEFSLWDMFKYGALLFGDLFSFDMARVRGDKRYLRGKRCQEMDRLAEECFRNAIRPKVSPWAVECIENHRKDGYGIVLITGSVDILARPLSRYLGADHLICTTVGTENGRYTGHCLTPYPYGETKRRLLEDFSRKKGIDLSESYGYGDRHTDIPFLSSVGNPIAVNPDRKLHKYARRNRWKIVQF